MLTTIKKILSLNDFNFLQPNWKPSIWSCIAYFFFPMYPVLIAYNYSIREVVNLATMTTWCSTMGSCLQIIVKYIVMLLNRQKWLTLIGTADAQRRQDAQSSPNCRLITARYNRRFVLLIKFLYLLYNLTLIMFSIFPLLKTRPFETPLSLDMPFWDGHVEPFWQLNYVTNIFIIFFAENFIIAMDGITFFLVFHASCRCDVIVELLQEMDSEIGGDCSESVDEQLLNIIRIHCEIKEFMALVERQFSFTILVQFFSATIIICMTLTVIAMDLMNSVYLFLLASFSQTFFYCLCGNYLAIKNDNLVRSIYNVKWHLLTLKSKKNLKFLLQSAQRPLQLTSIFLPMNMASFLQILKASYSYFALLSSMDMKDG